ncbi:MAG: CpXC domain-containing protein [Roseiflexus sp.]|nr:CpXC domain-containing protein [Roseiflexus sp.]MCS7288059.1 CpXC domain-containing protein [Roseiflexus sp.]MDW8233398.1 CpXC domain-containing protein [Roseiflexaceae bacterium]
MTTGPSSQTIQLACPSCRAPLRASVVTIIDAAQHPELKARLIAGQLNMAMCPSCGMAIMISAPLFYHDAAKQLAFVHFPQQLNARQDEQERFIGDATALIMRALPPNAPRGYLLAPRRFLTLNSLIDAVLEADGVSREKIEAHRQRVDLIGRLAEAAERGDEALAALVDQHRDAINDEFFAAIDAFIAASRQVGRDDSAQLLLALRRRLAAMVGFTGAGDAGDMPEMATSEAVERLIAASDDELEGLIAELRPAIDYSFFEAWTARIDQAEQAGDRATAERLTARRSVILETVERMDREAQAVFEAAASLLREALDAPDPERVLRERSNQINEAFMLVVQSNLAAAERSGQTQLVERLRTIERLATQIVEESLSPEDRFINQLLQAETPQSATKLLRQNLAMITPAFVKRLNELADQMDKNGRKPAGERLRQLAREASVMLF